MSPERAVEIIENLVDGVHPLTGEILPEDNICEEKRRCGCAELCHSGVE